MEEIQLVAAIIAKVEAVTARNHRQAEETTSY